MIDIFKNGIIEDARLYGDGYDFQVNVNESIFLTDIKGIREKKGQFKLTEKEYNKALEYKNDYIVTVVINMNDIPKFLTIDNPVNTLNFRENTYNPESVTEYYSEEVC